MNKSACLSKQGAGGLPFLWVAVMTQPWRSDLSNSQRSLKVKLIILLLYLNWSCAQCNTKGKSAQYYDILLCHGLLHWPQSCHAVRAQYLCTSCICVNGTSTLPCLLLQWGNKWLCLSQKEILHWREGISYKHQPLGTAWLAISQL